MSPFLVSKIGIGYEQNAYVWIGYGVWTQLWASLTLPLPPAPGQVTALGAADRFIEAPRLAAVPHCHAPHPHARVRRIPAAR